MSKTLKILAVLAIGYIAKRISEPVIIAKLRQDTIAKEKR